jgi:hypothetical protein
MDYEAEKIAIERDKLDFEKTKLASEEKRATWTKISVGVPLFAVLATVVFGFWSTREQAKSQFKLEIAKAVMSAPTIAEGFDRLRLVKGFFPADAADVVMELSVEDKRSDAFVVPSQRELFRAMVAHDMKPRQILDLYKALFPEDDWALSEKIRDATDPSPQLEGSGEGLKR